MTEWNTKCIFSYTLYLICSSLISMQTVGRPDILQYFPTKCNSFFIEKKQKCENAKIVFAIDTGCNQIVNIQTIKIASKQNLIIKLFIANRAINHSIITYYCRLYRKILIEVLQRNEDKCLTFISSISKAMS